MANPFKDLGELQRDIESYLRTNRTAMYNNSKRISDFFEMACYNNIVRFYENNGYEISLRNLKSNKFVYKTTTAGNPANYSYFEVKRKIGNIDLIFEIRHNINVQSYHANDTFTTPDISIIKPNSILIDTTFYTNARRYFYIKNRSLISFCEVKNFNPYPELLFSYIGVVNELRPYLLTQRRFVNNKHIASSLMISGKSNSHTDRIIANLQSRYHINILCDLFNIGGVTFGRNSFRRVKTV
ncbi:hypothetical protein [Flavobacterium sedimenticola]|uniref:Uncharacterized protein n=1 Tax=Flavobacterium sedimenticola TaxID=3043286 RepID=A0ABT6XP57_9FLAO|nr:hypothetical protein [Flavobacterium sedimenticola]MDI9256872.1 hypothetical protein [Flavobacterium sedimenticola]